MVVAALETHRFRAFGGASCEIHTCGVASDELSRAVADVYAFEGQLTRFDPESELSRFNAAAGAPVNVSPLLEAMLRATLDAHALSDGLVNAAVLPALIAAGYDRSIEEVRRRSRPPTPQSPAQAPGVPPLPEVLTVGPGWAQLRRGCAIDLGGVGKGWLADQLCERLGNAAVNLGGDLRAIGEGPDGDGWCVGLCDASSVRVRDAGVATSGTSGRSWSGGHHLVDPRTGRPAETDVAAVTVIAATALRAEVLAKAAAVLGAVAGEDFAHARGAARVRVVPTVALEPVP
jgi:thiamine biosynthesis lipoprotein